MKSLDKNPFLETLKDTGNALGIVLSRGIIATLIYRGIEYSTQNNFFEDLRMIPYINF